MTSIPIIYALSITVTGFLKAYQNVTLGLFHFIAPVIIPYMRQNFPDYKNKHLLLEKFRTNCKCHHLMKILYSTKFWQGKTLMNRSFQSFGEENVGKFTIVNVSYFSEPGIWLGKILANDVLFAKFTKVFPCQNFALYGKHH